MGSFLVLSSFFFHTGTSSINEKLWSSGNWNCSTTQTQVFTIGLKLKTLLTCFNLHNYIKGWISGKPCIIFLKHIYRYTDTVLCHRIISKLSLFGDICLHLQSSNRTNRSNIPKTAQNQLLPNKGQMLYLSDYLLIKAMCTYLMYSTRVLKLWCTVFYRHGNGSLNEQL